MPQYNPDFILPTLARKPATAHPYDEEFDEAYEKQQANMPTFKKLMSAQGESAGGRVGKGKKKKVVVKKRANFLGRGAGVALRGF